MAIRLGADHTRLMMVAACLASIVVATAAYNRRAAPAAGQDPAEAALTAETAGNVSALVAAPLQEAKVVKPSQPLTFRVGLPAARGAAKSILRVAVSAYEPAARSGTAFVVTMRGTEGGQTARVGNFAMFPATAFVAQAPNERRIFQFDLTRPLRELGLTQGQQGPIDITITAGVPAGRDGAGDAITVASVDITPLAATP